MKRMPPDGVTMLPRSTSVKATSSSPLTVNTSRQPLARSSASTPTTPVFSRQKPPSINCMAATSTDTPPPATPKDKQPKSASYYALMWSPRKLMQRASRAFRGSGRSRRKKNMDTVGDTDSPRSVASKGSDVASVQSLDEQITDDDVHGGVDAKPEEEHHLEVVPEKIIHEANPSLVNHLPAVAEDQAQECMETPEKETPAAAGASEVVEEEKTKKGAAPALEDAAAEEEEGPEKGAAPAPEDVAATDKFMTAKEKAITKKREEEIMAEVVRRFQGSRVKTAMEKRSDEAQPRRRESARSNDVIEEAKNKLLEMRQGGRVKALVGAFETVMDGNHLRTAAGKPQLNLRA